MDLFIRLVIAAVFLVFIIGFGMYMQGDFSDSRNKRDRL